MYELLSYISKQESCAIQFYESSINYHMLELVGHSAVITPPARRAWRSFKFVLVLSRSILGDTAGIAMWAQVNTLFKLIISHKLKDTF